MHRQDAADVVAVLLGRRLDLDAEQLLSALVGVAADPEAALRAAHRMNVDVPDLVRELLYEVSRDVPPPPEPPVLPVPPWKRLTAVERKRGLDELARIRRLCGWERQP